MADQPLTSQEVAATPQPQVLLEVWTMFPFDLFPAKVRLTAVSIVVIEYFLFGEHHVSTLMLKDILTVEAGTSLIFGTLILTPRVPTVPPLKIPHLANRDVDKLKDMIQGLLVLDTQQVDVTQARTQVVKDTAQAMGQITAT